MHLSSISHFLINAFLCAGFLFFVCGILLILMMIATFFHEAQAEKQLKKVDQGLNDISSSSRSSKERIDSYR